MRLMNGYNTLMLRSLSLAVLSLLATFSATALSPLPPQPADVPWPTEKWTTASLPAGVDEKALQNAMQDAFGKKIAALGDTRAVVIIQGGRLVYEQYAEGF